MTQKGRRLEEKIMKEGIITTKKPTHEKHHD
jgi:hypothetical protein